MHLIHIVLSLASWATIATASPVQHLDGPTGQGGVRVKLTRRKDIGDLEKRANGIAINNRYWVTLGIGTPPQDLNFLPDSGANAFAVQSTLLPPSQQGDAILYDPSKSSSAKQLPGYTWSQFGSGVVYNETITIGGQVFTNVPLCVTNNQSGPSYGDRSGNMGMDPTDQPTSPNGLPSLMHTIMGRLPQPVATFSYNNYLDEGELDLGFIDSNKYTGVMTYLNLKPGDQFWNVDCQGVVVNGKVVPNTAFNAILDHGTGDARVPKAGMDAYFAQVPGAVFNSGAETYDFPCDANLPDFSFSIGFLQVNVSKYSWRYGPVDGTTNTCRSNIKVPGDNPTFGFFGEAWLESVFVVFDYKNSRVGLANRPAYSTNVPTISIAGSLKLCQGVNFTGTCTNAVWQSNTCGSLSGTPYYHNVGSYSPSQGYCTFYQDTACASPLGYASGVRAPGISNTYGYQNMFGSFACFFPTDYPPRYNGVFRFCDAVSFGGNCQDISWSSFACQNLPSSLNKNVLSAGTNQGYCYLYTNRDCTGAIEDGAPFVYPGYDQLQVGKKVQSFMCV